jgi:hypothetical protein
MFEEMGNSPGEFCGAAMDALQNGPSVPSNYKEAMSGKNRKVWKEGFQKETLSEEKPGQQGIENSKRGGRP